MSRVRSAALSGVLTLSLLGLAACGSDSSDSDEGGASLSSVTIEGDQGKAPEVTFDVRLDGTKTEAIPVSTQILREINDPQAEITRLPGAGMGGGQG